MRIEAKVDIRTSREEENNELKDIFSEQEDKAYFTNWHLEHGILDKEDLSFYNDC